MLDGGTIVDRDRDDCVVWGKVGILASALIHCREHHGRGGKEVLSVPLDKGGRGRADADNQVERSFGKEGAEVFDERTFRVLIAGTGGDKRMIDDVERP